MQIALERGLAAHRHRLALASPPAARPCPRPSRASSRRCRARNAAPASRARNAASSPMVRTPSCSSCGAGLGPDAVDLAARQWPDLLHQFRFVDDRDAIGFVKFAGHLGDQLVRRHADRAAQARVLLDGRLNLQRQRASPSSWPPSAAVKSMYTSSMPRSSTAAVKRRNHLLEQARVAAVFIKIHGQKNRLRTQLRGLHQAHGRVHAKLARRIAGGGDDCRVRRNRAGARTPRAHCAWHCHDDCRR